MTGGKGTARCAAVLCGISLNRILSWLSVLIEAALGVNFFVPLLFSVDAQGVYRRGALFPLAMAPVLVVLPPLTQDFMRYDGPDKIKRVARLFFLLPLIAVALTCVNAGHEYPLVKRAADVRQLSVVHGGLPRAAQAVPGTERRGQPGGLGRIGKVGRVPRGGRREGEHPGPDGGNDHREADGVTGHAQVCA